MGSGLGSKGWWGGGLRDGVYRCHSIDRLPKLWLLHSDMFFRLSGIKMLMRNQTMNVCFSSLLIQNCPANGMMKECAIGSDKLQNLPELFEKKPSKIKC